MKPTLPLLAALAALFTLGSNCARPSGPPAPQDAVSAPPDAGAEPFPDVCDRACFVIRELGCPEGGPSCAGICQKARASGVADLKPACLAAARSKAEARACGSVACP